MAPDPTEDDVVVETWIAAKPEAVFPYLTDPARMVRWFGVEAAVEPRPGGIFRVNVNGKDTARGVVTEVIPPRRIAFTFGWEGGVHGVPPGTTTVTIDLAPERGGTRVTLRHSGLVGEDRDRHRHGWTHYASRLTVAAEGGEPGVDPFVTAAATRPPTP